MAKELNRTETTHIDEVARSANGKVQWLAENRNLKGAASHPITHNNRLELFICGEKAFADIAEHIRQAKSTIDMCCWGFDPGMELVRTAGTWPRGPTYGDLLIAAGKRGVRVRLLLWYDKVGSPLASSSPGLSHGTYTWYFREGDKGAKEINANASVERLKSMNMLTAKLCPHVRRNPLSFPVMERQVPLLAREEYCYSWYEAARRGLLDNITLRTRKGDSKSIRAALQKEARQPGKVSEAELEGLGMEHLGTHHQKSILIDYAFEAGRKATGYVMGLNSVSDYWDTSAHLLDDPRREALKIPTLWDKVMRPEFESRKPYQDYACRLDGGKALIEVYRNFVTGWDRAGTEILHEAASACTSAEGDCANPPAALLRKAQQGDSTVQIVRTQPEVGDHSIKEAYWIATSTACDTAGYMYIENQYFQYEDWCKHLLDARRETIKQWNKGSKTVGKSLEAMPVMYVFIVIPEPERPQMVPRTYDALATLGQQAGMTGQQELIDMQNKQKPIHVKDEFGVHDEMNPGLTEVVRYANGIDKPDIARLESEFGLKVSVAMLNTCAFQRGEWRYREIYIHSKLMIANDVFFTLGSANINQRSMAVDSELNIAVDDREQARQLRKRIFYLLSDGEATGGAGRPEEIKKAFNDMTKIMQANGAKKNERSAIRELKEMKGFLLPLKDTRSSTVRFG